MMRLRVARGWFFRARQPGRSFAESAELFFIDIDEDEYFAEDINVR
jgi:hypothetical protein